MIHTFFVPENLVRVLDKYDHNQFYYIGSSSESHTPNIHLSYNMAYGVVDLPLVIHWLKLF